MRLPCLFIIMKKKNKSLKITLIVVLIITILCGVFVIKKISKNDVDNNNKDEVIEDIVENNHEYDDLIKLYEENKNINDDYVGQLYFDSKLIDLPVVQGDTNDEYMSTDWKTMEYDIGGTIFVDCSNKIDTDQNIIIYGHNFNTSFDPNSEKMFSPLRILREKDNYEDNKIINLFLGDRLLRYQIYATYRVKIVTEDGVQYIAEDEPIYVICNYTNDEFDDYIKRVKERQYYDTGMNVENYDRLLTLQTCIDGQEDKYIILSKLIDEIDVN